MDRRLRVAGEGSALDSCAIHQNLVQLLLTGEFSQHREWIHGSRTLVSPDALKYLYKYQNKSFDRMEVVSPAELVPSALMDA